MSAPLINPSTPWASLLAASALALGLLVAPDSLPALPLCLFRALTGLPCPGCGLTRSFCALLHGHFAEAWALNPFGFVFAGAAILLLSGPLFFRLAPGLQSRLLASRAAFYACIALAASMFVYNLARITAVLL
jgi:hypothetical protein